MEVGPSFDAKELRSLNYFNSYFEAKALFFVLVHAVAGQLGALALDEHA